MGSHLGGAGRENKAIIHLSRIPTCFINNMIEEFKYNVHSRFQIMISIHLNASVLGADGQLTLSGHFDRKFYERLADNTMEACVLRPERQSFMVLSSCAVESRLLWQNQDSLDLDFCFEGVDK